MGNWTSWCSSILLFALHMPTDSLSYSVFLKRIGCCFNVVHRRMITVDCYSMRTRCTAACRLTKILFECLFISGVVQMILQIWASIHLVCFVSLWGPEEILDSNERFLAFLFHLAKRSIDYNSRPKIQHTN